jgi:hypothetical protein
MQIPHESDAISFGTLFALTFLGKCHGQKAVDALIASRTTR